jgi:hypothetical protein
MECLESASAKQVTLALPLRERIGVPQHMMPPTLVLTPRHSPDSQRLWKTAIGIGWGVERPGSNWSPTTEIPDPVIYGEAMFAYQCADTLGVQLVEPPEDWLSHVPDVFLRRDIIFTTLDDAYVLRYPAFVKPAGEKAFEARVYGSGAELRTSAAPSPGTMKVYVSDPVDFEVEYRCFVLRGRVITASVYIRGGRLAERGGEWPCDDGELNEAVLFAHGVVYRMGPHLCPEAFVLDVGRIRKRGWAVVKANPCWGSGLCGCDGAKVLEVLRRATISLPS